MNRRTPSPATGSPSRAASRRVSRAGALTAAAALMSVLVAACMEGRGSQDPSQQPAYDPNNPYAQQQQPQQGYAAPNGYGQPAPQGQYPQGTYPQQQGQYPQAQPQGYGTPAPGQYQPGQTSTATQPSPLSPPCQNDLICGAHKCNLQLQRCAFPCTANTDCAAGFTCMGAGGPAALCVPGAQ